MSQSLSCRFHIGKDPHQNVDEPNKKNSMYADIEFSANTFEEIAEMSKKHGMEMFQTQDASHMKAMQDMMELMKDPVKMMEWFESKKKEFEALPDN